MNCIGGGQSAPRSATRHLLQNVDGVGDGNAQMTAIAWRRGPRQSALAEACASGSRLKTRCSTMQIEDMELKPYRKLRVLLLGRPHKLLPQCLLMERGQPAGDVIEHLLSSDCRFIFCLSPAPSCVISLSLSRPGADHRFNCGCALLLQNSSCSFVCRLRCGPLKAPRKPPSPLGHLRRMSMPLEAH